MLITDPTLALVKTLPSMALIVMIESDVWFNTF